MLKILLNNKKAIITILTILGGFTALIQFHDSQVKSYKESISDQIKTQFQKEYNEQLALMMAERDEELKEEIAKYEKKLRDAEAAKDKYWQEHYEEREKELIAKYKTDKQGQEIKDDAKNKIGDDHTISSDTLRLLNKARKIVRKTNG